MDGPSKHPSRPVHATHPRLQASSFQTRQIVVSVEYRTCKRSNRCTAVYNQRQYHISYFCTQEGAVRFKGK